MTCMCVNVVRCHVMDEWMSVCLSVCETEGERLIVIRVCV